MADAPGATWRAWLGIAFFTIVCLCLLFPMHAHATYADVADSYGTIEEITPKGDPISGSSIPEGPYYNLEVRTSSSFCAVSNCSILVSGGQISVTFVLSTTYNAVYIGTAEEAAACTNEAGTDDSAYYMATPTDLGNQFTIPLSALNECIDLATFNGRKDPSRGKWYDRKVVFDASSEVVLAVQSGKHPSESSSDDGGSGSGSQDGSDSSGDKDKDSGKDSKTDSGSESSASQDGSTSTDAGTSSDSSSGEQSKSSDDSKDKDDKKAGAAGAAGSRNGGSGSSGGKTAAIPKPSAETEKAAAAASKATGHRVVPGIPFSVIAPEIEAA